MKTIVINSENEAVQPGENGPAIKKKENTVLINLKDFVVLVAGILLVFSFLFRIVVVSGPSMMDTLTDGDWLLLLGNVFYTDPKQGDIVVASKASFEDGTPIIKRVIATEGQTVNIDFQTGVVYVNGEALDEPYTLTPTNLFEGVSFPLTVADGCIFVMGDNRNDSKDSRSEEIGLIDTREVLGKAIFLLFPGTDRFEGRRIYNRIGVVS